MSKINKEKLLAGYVFGDIDNEEYVYLPGSEIGSEHPMCILEKKGAREDVSIEEAVDLVNRLALRAVKHPLLGFKSF
ncbi:MAG: hypothetical protein Q4D21_03270 [Phascolarctobacterium sp.]|nr:hypothetical protein [Phascolarctobacterium sp.]